MKTIDNDDFDALLTPTDTERAAPEPQLASDLPWGQGQDVEEPQRTAASEEPEDTRTTADFLWLIRTDGYAGRYIDPKHRVVLAVAYFDVEKPNGKRIRLNCRIDQTMFFEVEALEMYESRTAKGRTTIKLVPWREGLVLKRWRHDTDVERDIPGHSKIYVVRGDELVRR